MFVSVGRFLVVASLVGGCGFSPPPELEVDARVDLDPDAPIDAARPDAGPNCDVDGFDGTGLQSHWSLFVGELPTYSVGSSRLTITDAPRAATPSSVSTVSWIHDLDTDKGNQIGWTQAIGGEDFEVSAELAWSTTVAEVTFGGIAVTDSQGVIAALVGMADASTTTGVPWARIRGIGAAAEDLAYEGTDGQQLGSAVVKIVRVNGVFTIYVDDVEVLNGPGGELISNVSMYYLQHSDDSGPYTFGTVELREVQICRP